MYTFETHCPENFDPSHPLAIHSYTEWTIENSFRISLFSRVVCVGVRHCEELMGSFFFFCLYKDKDITPKICERFSRQVAARQLLKSFITHKKGNLWSAPQIFDQHARKVFLKVLASKCQQACVSKWSWNCREATSRAICPSHQVWLVVAIILNHKLKS